MPQSIDPATLEPRAVYRLLTSLVVPRPIAWVSTLAADGTRNIAPHSFYNMTSYDPPVVHFTSSIIAGVKDTLANVRATGEFVVNVVSADLVEAMNLTAADFPSKEDEFDWADLEPAPSTVVLPPRVAAARAALECRVHSELTIGTGTMVFGTVVWAHVDERVLDDGVADPQRLAAVGRLGGSAYAPSDRTFHLTRPQWARLREGHAASGED